MLILFTVQISWNKLLLKSSSRKRSVFPFLRSVFYFSFDSVFIVWLVNVKYDDNGSFDTTRVNHNLLELIAMIRW